MLCNKQRRFLLAGLAITGGYPFTSNAAELKTDRSTLSSFDEVSIRVPGNVEFVQSNEFGYSITGEAHVLKAIVFKVVGKRLVVDAVKEFETKKPVSITLRLPMLSRLELLSSADVVSNVQTDAQGVQVLLDGASNLDMRSIQTKKLYLQIKGSGSVSMMGKADRLELELTGSGDAKLRKLLAMDASVSISGSGEVDVFASKNLDASISGAGEIRYLGNPNVRQKITGAGDVQKVK